MNYVPKLLKVPLRAIPQWVAVGIEDPYSLTEINFVVAGEEFDVTNNQVVAALRPLTVAIGMAATLEAAIGRVGSGTLNFEDKHSKTQIASLFLEYRGSLRAHGVTIGRFEVRGSRERCVAAPYRYWNHWLQRRAAAKVVGTDSFAMSPATQQQIMILYMCPRPVVLVSVDDGSHRNLFPMDLIGPLGNTVFGLALRTTSRSVEAMKATRRAALSNLAATDLEIAYRLGNQHRRELLDWSGLPFAIERSAAFSLPVPATALRIRELEITDIETIGSHTFFICQTVSDAATVTAPLLCHTSGLYEHYRRRKSLPLLRA